MGLMDRMIRNMSVQEKEEMMLKMMPLMMKDVDMLKMMPVMMKEKMPEVMVRDETVREFISGMMMEIMPHCVQTFSPMMESEDQNVFLARLTDSITRAEGPESQEEEKRD